MKQGEEDFKFVKEEKDKTRNYILKKDKLTKKTVYILATVIVVCFIAFIIITIDLF
ncbi:hypothetical protein [uncultured Flavobacterium sp.]|uniref:hypothetical protein n=1 Tax=uncultured Flavobacterium sp. TaxID=165435 RepID=UPI0030ECABD2|tara:strand:- start:34016 stop:34183 length:168 start_codon:yes stop_codon:yes gene_type:complete